MKAECKVILSGFISVRSAIEAKSRAVSRIIFEKNRYEGIMRSTLRVSEKRQYERLKKSGIPIEFVSKTDFDAICGNPSAGGIAALCGERQYASIEALAEKKDAFLVILDGIEDPYNFGFTLRTLYAAGADGVILPDRRFYSSDEIVVRSSAGASELLHTAVVNDLTEVCGSLKEKGFLIISTDNNKKAKDIYKIKIKRPLCLVFGGEKRGISAGITEISDLTVRLKYPRECHFSLSATNAVSIISFEIARRISKPPDNIGNLSNNNRFRNT